MNIVFFGSDNFAVSSLRALVGRGHSISCVVTQPDKKGGRGLGIKATAIKLTALELGFEVYQPKRIDTAESIKFLKSLNPEIFVVIAYGQLLPQGVLDIPKVFSINVHASLLPRYRGAAPMNWAIIKGEATTGITVIKMTEKMDAGPVILQEDTAIDKFDTCISLEEKLAKLASEALIESLKSIEDKTYKLTEQDKNEASFAPKLKKQDGLIAWDKPAQEIYNLIRGCLGWPGAFTYYKGKLLKIYRGRVSGPEAGSSSPGEIIKVSKEGIVVACARDSLLIEELQIEGKKKMGAAEFISGHKINLKDILGYPAP